MAHVLHNNRIKFPRDIFLFFFFVHQHGADDVRQEPMSRSMQLNYITVTAFS